MNERISDVDTGLDPERDLQTTLDTAGDNTEKKVRDISSKVRETTGEVGHEAQVAREKGRVQAATSLERAAGKLHEQATETDGLPAEAGARVAEGMETAATYLRDHTPHNMVTNVESYVRAHPVRALAGGVIAGLVIGRVLL